MHRENSTYVIYTLAIIVAVLVTSVFFLSTYRKETMPGRNMASQTVLLAIGTISIVTEIADTPQERTTGLSGRTELTDGTGMLFVFNKKDYYSFWMKDMKFPIDIIFIDDSTVVDLFENTLPPQNINSELSVYKPKSPGNYVLEVNGGTASKNNLKIGDKIELKDRKSTRLNSSHT